MLDTFFPTLLALPIPFWLGVFATLFFGFQAWMIRKTCVGIPMLAVLATVAFWYFGDVLYNGYADYRTEFKNDVLEDAWWQVLLFICVFGLVTPWMHGIVNGGLRGRPSVMFHLVRSGGITAPQYQRQIDTIFQVMCILWVILTIGALIRTDFNFMGLFMPYFTQKIDPWGRGRVGSGYDSLLAVAGYTQIGLTATFGILAAVAARPRTLIMSLVICVLMLPFYLFDRTRSTMLVVLMPGFLTLLFMRLRVSLLIRVIIVVVTFLCLDYWFKFIIESRSETTISNAFIARMNNQVIDSATDKHLGLNMFEELGFINSFLQDGTYRPNWGEEYLAEVLNPIPRALWPGKPYIGIDYAIARGLSYAEADSNEAGVGASISTGMVGQGVVNFGQILGPAIAALLMSLWVALLARQDILGNELWRLLLYSLGLILTFNMGRDITLLVTYPFVFGFIGFFILRYYMSGLRPPLKASAGQQRVRPIPSLRFVKAGPRGQF